MVPVSAQRQGLSMESQACVPHLQGAGAQFADQTPQAAGARAQADHLVARKAAGETLRQRPGINQFSDSKLGI